MSGGVERVRLDEGREVRRKRNGFSRFAFYDFFRTVSVFCALIHTTQMNEMPFSSVRR